MQKIRVDPAIFGGNRVLTGLLALVITVAKVLRGRN